MKKRAFGKLHKELFYTPKREKLTEKVFRCRMAVSLLTILACTAVMATSTFALFYMDVSTDNSTIAGAYYSVTVNGDDDFQYGCPLVPNDKHTFEIKADGTATTGYCKIQVGEQVYYTEQIRQGSSLVLTVQAAKGTLILFAPGWGALPEITCGNEIIHSVTPSTTYTVEPTARLSSIAAHYGVTEEDILIYNNLLAVTIDEESTTPLLPVGMDLKIPNPAENAELYKVPYATYIVEPTATIDAISNHYGISIEDICAFNDMTAYCVGMTLKIPNADPYFSGYAVPHTTYIVEPTATLADIAAYYGVSETDVLLYNNISEISVDMPEGFVLKIPGVDPDTPSYVAPVPETSAEEETEEENENVTEDEPETPTACETCGEDPCVCDKAENVTEDEPETPTVCETCGEDPCACEKTENVTGDEPETPTVCETCSKNPCECDETEAAVEDESTEGEAPAEGESPAGSETPVDPEAPAEQESTEG